MADVRSVNLNLLLVFDALLETRSVTRAGATLGLTQSGTSNALAELRRVFADPLFERSPAGMRPTPRALQVAPHVRDGIRAFRRALAEPGFEPATAVRRFVFAAPDFVQLAVLPTLLRELGPAAPGVDLQVTTWQPQRVPDGVLTGAIDVFAGFVDPIPDGCGTSVLFDDRYVCILRPDHPAIGAGTLDREAWLALGHVVVTDRAEGGTAVDRALADQGLRRRIAVRVQSFLLVPPLIAATDLVAAVDSRVAAPFVASGTVVAVPPPIALPRGRVRMIWDLRAGEDPGARWFRERVQRAGAPSSEGPG